MSGDIDPAEIPPDVFDQFRQSGDIDAADRAVEIIEGRPPVTDSNGRPVPDCEPADVPYEVMSYQEDVKRRGIRNAVVEYADKERTVTPLTMKEIIGAIHQLTGRWPRRVGSSLFIHSEPDGIAWLMKPDALFGWLGSVTGKPAKFTQSAGCHTRAEVFAELTRTAQRYDAIEEYPHFPEYPTHFYGCPYVPRRKNGTLDRLLQFFHPETGTDEDLIRAMILTLFWGGPAGARPLFVITADEGRGCGKTKLAELCCSIVGGCISVEHSEDDGQIRTRLLSPEGMRRRAALIDNVKTNRFSSASLEGMVTAATISGKQLYVGEGQRPNTITYFATLNGPALSEDLAQRSVIIKLAKPLYAANWLEDVRQFIEDHRQDIIEDIAATFASEPTATLEKYTRWQSWEREVLSRVPMPADAQDLIRQRQGEVNCDRDEADIIEDYFARQIASAHLDPDYDRVLIPSQLVAEWMGKALGERIGAIGANRKINQMIRESAVHRLQENKSRAKGRGVIWWPDEADSSVPPIGDIECRLDNQRRSF